MRTGRIVNMYQLLDFSRRIYATEHSTVLLQAEVICDGFILLYITGLPEHQPN